MVVTTEQKAQEKLGLRILEATQKLKEHGLFDCSVKAGGMEFPAYSFLLAANSESLKKEIMRGEKEIILEGVKPEIVERCVALTYGEHGQDLEDNIGDILQGSSKIKFNGVEDFCFDFMAENLSVQNCFMTVERAKSYGRTEVLQLAEKFITENFNAVIETKEFLLLSKEDLLRYIEISNAGYHILWKAVMRWIDGTMQDQLLTELMDAIDIKNFAIEFLMETAWREPRVQDLAKEIIIQSLFSDLERLEEGMNIENCFSVQSFNQAHNTINKQAVKMTVTRFIAGNLAQIKDKDEFTLMDSQNVIDVIKNAETNEITKWEGLIKWINSDMSRDCYLQEMISILNFEKFSFHFLLEQVYNEPLVQKFESVKLQVINHLFSDRPRLRQNINKENCLSLKKVLSETSEQRWQHAEAEKIVNNHVMFHLDSVILKSDFPNLRCDSIISIFKSSQSMVQSDLMKWEAVLEWVKHEKAREVCLPRLIEISNFQDATFLIQAVWKQPLVQDCEAAKVSVITAALFRGVAITTDNCFFLVNVNRKYNSTNREKVRKPLIDFMARNFDEILQKIGFMALTLDDVIGILETTNETTEIEKWQAMMKWIKYDESRENYCKDLMTATIVNKFTFDFLYQTAYIEPLVQNSEEAKMAIVKGLFTDLRKLEENITIDNCFQLKDLNDAYNHALRDDAGEILIHFIIQHSEEITGKPEFSKLNKRYLMRRLLHSAPPNVGQRVRFAIFDKNATELSVLNLKDRISRIFIPLEGQESCCGMFTVCNEVYLVTNKRILKAQSDGRIITLQQLKGVQLHLEVIIFHEKIYIMQRCKGRRMFCFKPADNSFIEDLPECGLGPGFCVSSTKNYIYAMGGMGTERQACRFDPRTKCWSSILNMKHKRWNASAASLDGKIYVLGWIDAGLSVERYCPESDSWTELPRMDAPRRSFNVCVFDGRLYVVGGDGKRKENGFIESSIKVYNERLERWFKITKFETEGLKRFTCIWPHKSFKPAEVASSAIQDSVDQLAAEKAKILKAAVDVSRGKDLSFQMSEELNRRIKTKSAKSKIIGPHGGTVENFGWTATFHANAFNTDTKVDTAIITDLHDHPEGKIPIAPIFECSLPGRLNQPALLEAEHWAFPTAYDDKPVYAEVFRKNSGDTDWQFFKKVRIIANQKISFNTEHFSFYEIVMEYATWLWTELKRPFVKVTLQNLVYISGVDQSVACVCCLKDTKVRHDVLQTLENAGYRPILPLPAVVHPYRGREVKLTIRCLAPENMQVLNDDGDGNNGQREIETEFRVNTILNDCAVTRYLPLRLQDEDLKKFDGVLRFRYSHTADGDDNVRHLLQIVWPIPGASPNTVVNTYGPIRTGAIVAPNPQDNQHQ